ncbi:MAG TPA: RNA methyltransferase [Bdellovibrionota bacterium]|nr:RNA methyltransferase [Bdellovibrionota bacterium]
MASLEIFAWGTHVVKSALASSTARVHEIFVSDPVPASAADILKRVESERIPVRRMNRNALADKLGSDKSQNLGIRASLDTWDSVSDWLESSGFSTDAFLGIAMDEIQDPQNVGSLIRSTHFFGGSLVLMARDRAAPLTGSVAKASAGTLFSLPIVRAANLARELDACREGGIWCVGLAADAEKPLESLDFAKSPVMLVVGSEGSGLRNLTAKKCDEMASLPGKGEALNAAVAGAVAVYEISKQRARKKAKS